MKTRHIVLLVVVLVGVCGPLRAQDGQDSKTYTYHTDGSLAQSSRQSAQEVEDIGVIDETGAATTLREKLRFNVDLRTAYTSNALLRGNNSSGDELFLPTVEAAFHTALDKHFNFDLDTKVESAIYSRYQDHGFAGYSSQATLDYHIAPGLPRFYTTIEPYRYDSFSGKPVVFDSVNNGHLFTEAIGFTGGTDWGIALNGGRTLGFLGYSFTDYISDPGIDSRLVHRVVAGFAHQILSNLTAQLYYVYQYSDFTDFDRSDSKSTVSGALIYQFNDHWYGSWTTSFINQESSEIHASYLSISTSVGLSLHF